AGASSAPTGTTACRPRRQRAASPRRRPLTREGQAVGDDALRNSALLVRTKAAQSSRAPRKHGPRAKQQSLAAPVVASRARREALEERPAFAQKSMTLRLIAHTCGRQ